MNHKMTITSFVAKMKDLQESLQSADDAAADYRCRVRAQWMEDLKVQVRAGKHRFTMDDAGLIGEPETFPNPGQYLMGALAACEAMMFLECAAVMDIQLDDIEVIAEGCLDLRPSVTGAAGRPGFYQIDCEVTVKTPAPPDRIEQLAQVVEQQCPVADTLRSGCAIHHKLSVIQQ
jgi:putative redox protein